MDRKSFATEKEIWWELDKLAIKATKKEDYVKATDISRCMKHLEKPIPSECRKFYNLGY